MDTHQTGKSIINGVANLHFIVTRPEGQQQELITRLKALNNTQELVTKTPAINIIHLPLISIESHRAETSQLNLESFKGIIFISKNAVKYSKSQLSEKQWESLLEKPLYAIGNATANLLKSELDKFLISNEVIYPDKAISESLLALNQLQEVEEENWLIVKGVDGRNKLITELTNRKAVVSELAVYERNEPSSSIQKKIVEQRQSELKATSIRSDSSTATIWLVSSAVGMENLSNILNRESQEHNFSVGCLVMTTSDRITKIARNLGFKVVAQSNNATDEALFSCVRDLIQKVS